MKIRLGNAVSQNAHGADPCAEAARVQHLYFAALAHLRTLVEDDARPVEDALSTVLARHVLGLVQRGDLEKEARRRHTESSKQTAALRYRRATCAAAHLKSHTIAPPERLRFADVNANAAVALHEGHGDYFKVLHAIARATGQT